jgi:hypothetical protein
MACWLVPMRRIPYPPVGAYLALVMGDVSSEGYNIVPFVRALSTDLNFTLAWPCFL